MSGATKSSGELFAAEGVMRVREKYSYKFFVPGAGSYSCLLAFLNYWIARGLITAVFCTAPRKIPRGRLIWTICFTS